MAGRATWATCSPALPRTLGTLSLVLPPDDICLGLWLCLHTASVSALSQSGESGLGVGVLLVRLEVLVNGWDVAWITSMVIPDHSLTRPPQTVSSKDQPWDGVPNAMFSPGEAL